MSSVSELVNYADEFLRLGEINDWPNALNGLQIENSGRVTKIGAAVDISTHTINDALERKIGFLLVHHGLFWGGLNSISGSLYRILKTAISHDIALYSAHLPLDLHPEVGNNAQLATSLGFDSTEAFLEVKGQPVGLKSMIRMSRDEIVGKLEHSLGGEVKVFAFGASEVRNVAIITGGAGGEIREVAAQGIDTFITGEAPHWAAVAAEELGINLLLGGHYATETFGVKAFAAHLSGRFKLPWEFIDHPTGL